MNFLENLIKKWVKFENQIFELKDGQKCQRFEFSKKFQKITFSKMFPFLTFKIPAILEKILKKCLILVKN